MNNWICPKCNTANTDRFCLNCGEDSIPETQSAPDLPPTVFGVPPIVPNQFQSQPQFQPNQSAQVPPQQQQFEPQMSPQKLSGKKFALIGGVIGLLVIVGIGFALWAYVINPYMKEQARLKKQSDDQTRANSTTAMSLLPSEFNTIKNDGKFQKEKTMDSLQLLQASQNLPKELKEAVKDIKDAAAAEYGTAGSSEKVALQIFKYGTPDQALDACRKISGELEKNKSAFEKVTPFVPWVGIPPSRCQTTAKGKNNQYISVNSYYGFLYIASGREDPAMGASMRVTSDLSR